MILCHQQVVLPMPLHTRRWYSLSLVIVHLLQLFSLFRWRVNWVGKHSVAKCGKRRRPIKNIKQTTLKLLEAPSLLTLLKQIVPYVFSRLLLEIRTELAGTEFHEYSGATNALIINWSTAAVHHMLLLKPPFYPLMYVQTSFTYYFQNSPKQTGLRFWGPELLGLVSASPETWRIPILTYEIWFIQLVLTLYQPLIKSLSRSVQYFTMLLISFFLCL